MEIDRELRARVRSITYHQKKALKRIGEGTQQGIGRLSLVALVSSGWVTNDPETQRLSLSDSGKKIRDALDDLGWLPPD
jgi:hypothetical protein